MNEKEGPMNMNVTPPVEPVTEFEVPLPPDRKRPKWLVPLIAGGTAVVVLAAVGTGGYLYWNHDRLTAASEECATSYDRAVKARKKLTEYLESDAVKTAIRVKDSEVKDAKTVGTLASTVKAVEKTKTDIPECPADGLKDIKAVTARLDKTATAYEKTVNEVRGKANAVNASKTDKTVADATKVLDDSKGRVKDDKVRTALENAIKSKDGKAISDAMKAVNDSIKAKSDADANARAERRSRRRRTRPRRRTTAPTRAEQPEDTPNTPVVATRNPRAAATRTLHSSPQVVRPAAVIRRRHSRSHSSLPRAVATEAVPREGATDMKICVSHIPLTVRPQSRFPAVNLSFQERGRRILFSWDVPPSSFMGLSFRFVSLVGAGCGE